MSTKTLQSIRSVLLPLNIIDLSLETAIYIIELSLSIQRDAQFEYLDP